MCITTTEALHTIKTLIKDDVYECCEASMDKETVTEKLEKIEKYIKKIDKKGNKAFDILYEDKPRGESKWKDEPIVPRNRPIEPERNLA